MTTASAVIPIDPLWSRTTSGLLPGRGSRRTCDSFSKQPHLSFTPAPSASLASSCSGSSTGSGDSRMCVMHDIQSSSNSDRENARHRVGRTGVSLVVKLLRVIGSDRQQPQFRRQAFSISRIPRNMRYRPRDTTECSRRPKHVIRP